MYLVTSTSVEVFIFDWLNLVPEYLLIREDPSSNYTVEYWCHIKHAYCHFIDGLVIDWRLFIEVSHEQSLY